MSAAEYKRNQVINISVHEVVEFTSGGITTTFRGCMESSFGGHNPRIKVLVSQNGKQLGCWDPAVAAYHYIR